MNFWREFLTVREQEKYFLIIIMVTVCRKRTSTEKWSTDVNMTKIVLKRNFALAREIINDHELSIYAIF